MASFVSKISDLAARAVMPAVVIASTTMVYTTWFSPDGDPSASPEVVQGAIAENGPAPSTGALRREERALNAKRSELEALKAAGEADSEKIRTLEESIAELEKLIDKLEEEAEDEEEAEEDEEELEEDESLGEPLSLEDLTPVAVQPTAAAATPAANATAKDANARYLGKKDAAEASAPSKAASTSETSATSEADKVLAALGAGSSDSDSSSSSTSDKSDSSSSLSMFDYRAPVADSDCAAEDATVVSSVSQLSNSLLQRYRVVCFAPGDYRSADPIQLTLSGSAAEPRVIRSTQDSSLAVENSGAGLPLLPQISMTRVQHWVVQGVHLAAELRTDESDPVVPMLSIVDSNNVVLSENKFSSVETAISLNGDNDNISLQDNWIVSANPSEAACVQVSSATDSTNIRLISNQLNDCQTGIALAAGVGSLHFVVAENDIHQASNQCADAAIAVEATGSLSYNSLVVGNRATGWKQTDDCDLQPAALKLGPTDLAVTVERNIFWDNDTAIAVADGAADAIVRDNLLANNAANRAAGEDNATLELVGDSTEILIANNHVLDSRQWLYSTSADLELSCNVLISGGDASGTPPTSGVIDRNTYLDSSPGIATAANGSDHVFADIAWAKPTTACVTANQLNSSFEFCTSGMLSYDSPVDCGSTYWTAQKD